MAGFNENQFRAWERGAPATRQAVSTAFQGVPVGSAPTPLPPETPTLGSAMAQRMPRNTGGGAGGILPEEVAERLYGRTPQPWRAPTATEFMRPRGAEFVYEPPPTGWKAMRAPIPNNAPRFGADLGARMAAASGPVVGMPPPPATGAMADLRAVGRPLGAALQKAASVGSAVAPIVNNPLTRTAARFAGPAAMAYGAYSEVADPQSPASQHGERALSAAGEGHYGDALREGWLAAGNVIGAATGVRPLVQGAYGLAKYLTSPRQPAQSQPLLPAPSAAAVENTMPAARMGAAQGVLSENYLGPVQRRGFAQQLAERQQDALDQRLFPGDPGPAYSMPMRAYIQKMIPRQAQLNPSESATAAALQQIDADYAGEWQAAGADAKRQRAARDARLRALMALSQNGRGYLPTYMMSQPQPEE
jgi:hypothetical protein